MNCRFVIPTLLGELNHTSVCSSLFFYRTWDQFAGYRIGEDLNVKYQQLELMYFNRYLKGKEDFNLGEAIIFYYRPK